MPNPVLLIGTPPWVLPGASLDMDFVNGRSFVRNGSKSFTSLLSCTRAQTVNSYALNSGGSLVTFLANALRITDKGLLVEQASTNLALWSRDFTNSAWVKVNVTAALDQIGAEGTANTASSLTATANSGTALQTITLASSQRTLSFWLKRITGTGTIKISQDGITWTDVTASINSTGYSLVQLTATQLNPVIGFQFGTSGDKVAVDMAGLEAGAFATSPIATTSASVTRNADVVTLTGAALAAVNGASGFGAYLSLGAIPGWPGTLGFLAESSGNRFMYSTGNTQLGIYNGTTVLAVGSLSSIANGFRAAIRAKPSDRAISAGGGTIATDSNSQAVPTTMSLGNIGGTNQPNAFIKRVAIFPTLSNAQITALTQ